jgi:uncharacterized protein YkwD
MAQRAAGLRMEAGPKSGSTVTGKIILRIGKDPFSRPANEIIVLKIDSREVLLTKTTPAELEWDSGTVQNGQHVLRLIRRNTRLPATLPDGTPNPEANRIVEQITFRTDNQLRTGTNPENPEQFSTEQLAVLRQLNLLRRGAGLGEATLERRLCDAATAHAGYLKANAAFGHNEEPSKPGYLGRTPSDRAKAKGYPNGVGEVVGGGDTPSEALTGLMAAPYHRRLLLEPGTLDIGVGVSEKTLVINTALRGARTPAVVRWPYPDQTGVKLRFEEGEVPNPLRIHPDLRYPTGTVISVIFWGMNGRPILDKAELTDENGRKIEVRTNTPQNDDQLSDGFLIIPKAPLRNRMTYSVKITGSNPNGSDFESSWSFTTYDGAPKMFVPRASFRTDGRGTTLSLALRNNGDAGAARIVVRLTDAAGKTEVKRLEGLESGAGITVSISTKLKPVSIEVVPVVADEEQPGGAFVVRFDQRP